LLCICFYRTTLEFLPIGYWGDFIYFLIWNICLQCIRTAINEWESWRLILRFLPVSNRNNSDMTKFLTEIYLDIGNLSTLRQKWCIIIGRCNYLTQWWPFAVELVSNIVYVLAGDHSAVQFASSWSLGVQWTWVFYSGKVFLLPLIKV